MNTTATKAKAAEAGQASTAHNSPLERSTASLAQPTKRNKKPVYRPAIRIVDFAAGCFLVSSRSQPGHWHEVTVPTSGCDCYRAAMGRECSHLVLASAYQAAILAARRQRVTVSKPVPVANSMQTCDICGTQYWGRPAAHWCSCQQPVTPAPIQLNDYRTGAAGLAELFS